MKCETLNDGPNPSWEPIRERCWEELSDPEKATRVANRILGPSKAEGTFIYARAAEDLWPNEIVTIDSDGHATTWSGSGTVSGFMISPLKKGAYGWVQIR